MTAPYSIPPPHAAEPAAHGLLNTPGDVLAGWLFAFACALGLWLIMGRTQETMAALWRPWAAWLARLHVAVAGLGVWIALFVLEAPVWLENISLDLWRWGKEQLRRLAYMGFWPPILT